MKIISVKTSINCLLISLFGLMSAAMAATPTVLHEEFTRVIDNSIQWAQHLNDEVAKGKKMDRVHARQEMTSLQESLKNMTKAYLELSKQPAPEVAEGHFIAIKKNQARAEAELKVFEAEFGRPNPDYGVMNRSVKKIESNLKEAAKAHNAELTELDVK